MIGRALDSFIGIFSPLAAARRMHARATMAQMQAYTGGQSGYQAGKLNRLTKAWAAARSNENAQPRTDIARLRALSWDLYRNNPQAKKICRSLESKVIGRGLKPQSQAVNEDGTPNVPFRTRAHELWRALHERLDYRGKPGSGGQDFTELSKLALRSVILGGEVLYRFRPQEKQKDSLPAVKIQLIHADRLADQIQEVPGGMVYFGIQLDANEQRVAYHIFPYHPSDPRGQSAQSAQPVAASEMGHLYIAEDIDQLRGTPWFSAALLKMREASDYEFNELKAAAVSACVVLGYRRSAGQTQFGVNQPDDWDLTDADGNAITAIQPGMLLDLGKTGEIQGFNPQRPNTAMGEFMGHMLRSQATAVPGVKGSTLTGDFRQSSFSSERSADNDVWPELEGLQDWFAGSFCQPIYERVVSAAVAAGWFDEVEGFDAGDFLARRDEYIRCEWKGPVARSINPKDDAEASRRRVQNGQSTPQKEIAAAGGNWQENIMQVAEFIEFCGEQEIPESLVAQMLGIDQQDDPMGSIEEKAAELVGETPPDAPPGPRNKKDDMNIIFKPQTTVKMPRQKTPRVRVNVPQQEAPTVVVNTPAVQPTINIPEPVVNVNVEAPPPADVRVNVPAPVVNVEAPKVTVNPTVNPTPVQINMPAEKEFDIEPVRDKETGRILRYNRVPKK